MEILIGVLAGIGTWCLLAVAVLVMLLNVSAKTGGGKQSMPGWLIFVPAVCVGVIVALLL